MIRTHERFEFVTRENDVNLAYERAAFPNKVGVGGYPHKVRDEQAKSEIPQEERFKADWGEVLKSEKSKWEISKPTEGQNGVMLQRVKERVAVILTERVRAIDLDKKAALLAITSGKTYKPTFIRLDDLNAVEKSLKELSGARALLRGFIYLGHPTSLAKNPEMVRLLSEQHGIYGMDQVRDAATAKKDFNYLRPNTGEVSKRTEALKVALFEALHPADKVKIPTQRFEEIEGTLAKLKNAIDEVNLYAK